MHVKVRGEHVESLNQPENGGATHAPFKASMGLWRLLPVLVLMIHQARILLVKAQTTFDYPPFNDTNLLFGGDTQLNEDAFEGISEVTLNTGSGISFGSPGTCASLLYGKPLQMRGKSSSFTTSFTFSMAGTSSAGFAFVLLPQNRTAGIPGGKLCLMPRNLDATNSQFFAVEFDTFKNPEFNDPSNNHIGVNINSMNSSATYNLCGDGIGECTYLVFDLITSITIVHDFTSWIEYDSVTKNLAVFLTNGSTLNDIAKPASAIIKAPVDLSDVMTDNMFVGFTGSTNNYDQETKRIVSWSFSTSARLTEAPPPLGPINNGTSPPLAPINNGTSPPLAPINDGTSPGINGPPIRAPGLSPANIVPASSTGGSGSNGSKAKLAAGFAILGVAVLLTLAIGYKLFRLFRRPLRFFLSHAGGKDQGGKNFPDWLYDEMTSSWKLKHFIKVFLDRRCLEKGKEFPAQIMQELQKTEVGIVVVTPEFFTRKWPMTELISFMRSKPAVTILPLFYRMTVAELKDHLTNNKWDEAWKSSEFSEGNHPIPPQECHKAVKRLCGIYGTEYSFSDEGHDREYIKLILKDVGKILRNKLWKR